MNFQSKSICTLVALAVASLVAGARAAAITITEVDPTSSGQIANIGLPSGGFVKIGSDTSNPGVQVNTSPVLSNFTPTGGASFFSETGSANHYQFVANNVVPAINDPFGDNTNFTVGANRVGQGYSFTVANSPVANTVNVYVGEFDAISQLTVSNTLGTFNSAQIVGNGNFYTDLVFTIPANSGTTTVNWTEIATNGSTDNASIFAATASVPEPSAWLLMGLSAAGLVAVLRRGRRS